MKNLRIGRRACPGGVIVSRAYPRDQTVSIKPSSPDAVASFFRNLHMNTSTIFRPRHSPCARSPANEPARHRPAQHEVQDVHVDFPLISK